jgi:hypothetical protein
MAQTLLCTTLKVRPIIPVCSIPSLEQYRYYHPKNFCSGEVYDYDTTSTRLRCRHLSEIISTKTMISFKSWLALGSATNDSSRQNSIITTGGTTRTFVALRGGSDETMTNASPPLVPEDQTYTILSDPAPGSPFHYAFPVHNLQLAKEFYGNVLGCVEGRSSPKWQDYSLHGHQIVAHWVGDNYRCQDYYNPVDGDEVPVPRKSLVAM